MSSKHSRCIYIYNIYLCISLDLRELQKEKILINLIVLIFFIQPRKGEVKKNKLQTNKKIESETLNSFNQLTSSQSRRINALIRKECCNYENGNCLLLDEGHPCICPQCITPSHIICNWFKTAVLPLNQDLSLELYNRKYKKKCEVCNKPFFSKAYNVKYCQDCRKIMNTIQSAERMRKKRCHVTE